MELLVLGHKGMLGHMVTKYLKQYHSITTIDDYWPDLNFEAKIKSSKADYVINCIGAIPQRTDTFDINFKLPIFLEKNFRGRVVHPGTDCEIDRDEYGLSKKAARDYIVGEGTRSKIIKSSIIGPELNSSASLLEWFLNAEDKVSGYSKAMWSGITTLQWAKVCKDLLDNWESFDKENIVQSTCLSKYDLLVLIKQVFNKDIEIVPNDNVVVDKCLSGTVDVISIEDQLKELKDFYYDN